MIRISHKMLQLALIEAFKEGCSGFEEGRESAIISITVAVEADHRLREESYEYASRAEYDWYLDDYPACHDDFF